MTEPEVKNRLSEQGVSRETMTRLDAYVARLAAENAKQNLISAHSLRSVWDRHILDSAQLRSLVERRTVDVGSGAGLPGLILAILGIQVELVEPRRRRAEFLRNVASELSLNVPVHAIPIERLSLPAFDTITARAYAPLDQILETTLHLSHVGTRWVLPKGRSGMSELEVARRTWHGDFHTLPSITDPDAVIIVAEGVRRKAHR